MPGRNFLGGGFTVLTPAPGAPTIGIGRRGPINNWTNEVGSGATVAHRPAHRQARLDVSAVRRDRCRHADDGVGPALHRRARGIFLRARRADREGLWKANLGGSIVMAPITYRVDGQQYVSVISGHTLVTFALRD